MRRVNTEILHYNAGVNHDKVYIIEILEEDNMYYVYANYGKRTMQNLVRQLKLETEYEFAATRELEKLVKKKTKEGYRQLANGVRLDIPGFQAILKPQPQVVRKNIYKDEAPAPEHRRLNLD